MKHTVICMVLCSLASLLMGVVGYSVSEPGSLDTQSPSLALIAPNGNETWNWGNTERILWYAGDSNLDNTGVFLWLSVDNGLSCSNIAEGLPNTLCYQWAVPQIRSDSCFVKIRVNDSFGNQSIRISTSPFSLLSDQLSAPEELTISIGDGGDVELAWLPVTQMLDGTPILPDGYQIYCSTVPPLEGQLGDLLGTTTGPGFTHSGASQTNVRLFYTVIAFINGDQAMREPRGTKPPFNEAASDINAGGEQR